MGAIVLLCGCQILLCGHQMVRKSPLWAHGLMCVRGSDQVPNSAQKSVRATAEASLPSFHCCLILGILHVLSYDINECACHVHVKIPWR